MLLEDVEALKKKIKALIAFRVIFATLLLGSFYLSSGYSKLPSAFALSYLIISLYVVTIVYSLLLVRVKRLVLFAYTQLVLDVIFEIILIYITGGIESWFSFTLILTVISSSIVLNKRAGYFIAILSSILYGALVNLQFYNVLPLTIGEIIEEKNYLSNIFVHTIAFYLTAYLSGYLSSRLEKTVKKLEEKVMDLRDLEYFNREVIEGLPSGLFTTDLSGKVLTFNRAAERITGVKKESLIGRRIDSVLPYFKIPFSEGRTEGTIMVDGVQKIVGLGVSPFRGIDESTKGFIGIFQDLTQLKRLEAEMKQKEKWAAIGELSSNIAHEIRNPLASLKGSIEMLKEDSIPKNHKERLMEIALNEMERLNRIITDFLTYSRPTPPECKKFDLHGLLDDAIELLKNVEQNNRNNISIQKNYNDIIEINADPQKMRQVFWNLGINAIEAMIGGGELIITTKNTGGFIEISFKDSGTGIAAKDIEKIFYPFFTTKEQGTGLGLAIAYRIVEEHNGIIRVDSRTGNGTIFNIMLPVTDEKA
jgi:two-component system, NtrC family, sensor histidine kinase PilS